MKISDLVPLCVLPTYSQDILYVHKDDIDKELCVCLFMDREGKTEKPVLIMHQTQMYLTRSLIDHEIEQTPENIDFYLYLLSSMYPDEYISKTLEEFEKFRTYHNTVWLNEHNTEALFDILEKSLEERDAKCKDYDKFYKLMNRYPAEPEPEYPITEDGEYDVRNMEIVDKFYEDVHYTDEEIIFMAKYSFNLFSTKFPGLSEYYMQCLDDLI